MRKLILIVPLVLVTACVPDYSVECADIEFDYFREGDRVFHKGNPEYFGEVYKPLAKVNRYCQVEKVGVMYKGPTGAPKYYYLDVLVLEKGKERSVEDLE